MSYGLPYKGNKSAIADWIIEHLPRAETLVDLFCGGCAVTHAALVSGKYAHIIANGRQLVRRRTSSAACRARDR